MMTYIDIMNAFYNHMETCATSANAQALYFYLVHCNNRKTKRTADGQLVWVAWFEVTNSQILTAMGWTDRRRFYAARQELLDANLIHYFPGAGPYASLYAINEDTLRPFAQGKAKIKPTPRAKSRAAIFSP